MVFFSAVPSTYSSAYLQHSRLYHRIVSLIFPTPTMRKLRIFNPLDPGTPRCPASRNLVNYRPPIDTGIEVFDMSPGVDLADRNLTCEEFIRKFLKLHVTHQRQCLPSEALSEQFFSITPGTKSSACSANICRVAFSSNRFSRIPIRWSIRHYSPMRTKLSFIVS